LKAILLYNKRMKERSCEAHQGTLKILVEELFFKAPDRFIT
jgi:hypothetical protein